MNNRRFHFLVGFVLLLLVAGSGCVSNQSPADDMASVAKPDQGTTPMGLPPLTIDTTSFSTLGAVVRQIGETNGGGVVLMAGMEDWPAPPLQLSNARYVDGLERLVSGQDGAVQKTPHYVFIYKKGYEQLGALTMDAASVPAFADTRISFAIGAGTDLFNALALLGEALDGTIVADNAVSEAWCGELFLEDAPVSVVLEALLKSALVPPSAIEVDYGSSYIFVRSTGNPNRQDTCLNRNELTGPQQALLAATVSLQMPRAHSGMVFQSGSLPLSKALPDLSAQLGVPITADAELSEWPVNVAIFNDVTLDTALNLLVWQWPIAAYGYRVEGNGIRLTRR